MSGPTASPAAAAGRHEGAEHRYLIAIAVVLAALMQVIDSSIVNVALPDMMGNLGANLDEIAWVSTGYILASVIVIPLTGWLGNLLGRKRYFVGSIIVFTASSFFCGAAHSLGALVFWRIVQGVGGGALMTVSQAVLFESFPTEEAGTAMALFGLGVMVGPTIGPTLGGWLVDNHGWPWIFYINIPVGILAAVMIATYVHDPVDQRRPPAIDYQGIALLIVSVGAIQYVLEHGQREDWFDSRLITSLSVIGVVGAAALLWRELTTDHPIDLTRWQVANCYMGRIGLINSGGASSGESDLAEAVHTIARVGPLSGDPYRLASELGMPPWRVQKAQKQARRWSRDSVAAAVRLVAALNADVKGAAADADYAVERAVRQVAELVGD